MVESLGTKNRKVEKIVEAAPGISAQDKITKDEFVDRKRRVWAAVSEAADVDVAFAFSDEHYKGDVPYLGANTNVSIEQVAFGLGPDPFLSGIIAGFEGVFIAGQMAGRSKSMVYPTDSLQLADEVYPVEGFSIKEILTKIAGKEVKRIGLLSPRQVVPAGILANLESVVGAGNVVDVQEPYQKIKNLKSDHEMSLITDAAYVGSIALRAMLAVFEPGMRETQVAAFGDQVAKWMGCEGLGFQTMVGAGPSSCVTMIGKATNRVIQEGEYAHVGTSYQRDGLTACVRRSLFAVQDQSQITDYQRFFANMVEEAFKVGLNAYVDVAGKDKPAKLQEQALVNYFNEQTEAVLEIVELQYNKSTAQELKKRLYEQIEGIVQGLARVKPYTGTHNAGYTECQEFYGAITLESDDPLDKQVVTMLDVALRGRGSKWLPDMGEEGEFEVIIPGFDFWVVEDTLGKYGNVVRNLSGVLQPGGITAQGIGYIPVNVQPMVGNINELKGND